MRRKNINDQQSRTLATRVTNAEIAYWHECADNLGLSMSQLVRSVMYAAVGSPEREANSYPSIGYRTKTETK